MADIFKAVTNNDLNKVRFFVSTGANILEKDEFRQTALHIAASMGHLEIAKLLVDSGSKVNDYVCYNGWTALHYASNEGHLEIAKLLVESGSDILKKTEDDWTALHLASSKGHLEIVKLLVESGMSNAMSNAMFNAMSNAVSNTNANILKKTEYGCTALHLASNSGHLDVVKYLVESGSNIEVVDYKSRTAIDVAKTTEIKEFLIEQLEIQQNNYILK